MISIITPVRNAVAHIEKVIGEVQLQTHGNKEHIIIDGGSEDGTVDVLKSRDDDINYWLSEADAGIYDAMNKGIDAAGGEWIYFLGADDAFYRPDTLETIFRQGELPDDIDLLLGNVLYPDGQLFRSRFSKKLYYKNSIHHQGAFYRRRVFNGFRYGLTEPAPRHRHFHISGDYQLNLMLFLRGTKCMYRDAIIARCGPGVSMAGHFAGYREEIVIRHHYLGRARSLPFDAATLLRYGWRQLR